MDWKEFDKTVLIPFEKQGDDACEFSSYAQVFTYTQIRQIASEAFKPGAPSHQAYPADEITLGEILQCPRCQKTGKAKIFRR